jgi:L-asparaginase
VNIYGRVTLLIISLIMGFTLYGAAQALPHVHLITTGGTIATGNSGYLKVEDFLKRVPDLVKVAQLTGEDLTSIGSWRMTPEIQFRLAQRVNELFRTDPDLAGIVITHGTDSLEETAFLIDLIVPPPRPVVFTAAQRPPTETDTDGPRNLLNAVRIAASPAARDAGVLVTLNDEIHAARNVRKTHAIALNAFQSPWLGPVGYVDGGKVYLKQHSGKHLTIKATQVEPRVDLLTLVSGSDGQLERAAVAAGAKGIVLEVFGRGNVPPPVVAAVKEARAQGVVVVFTTRTRGGRVELNKEARDLGVISGEDLDGLKARILLIVALGETADLTKIQGYYTALSATD